MRGEGEIQNGSIMHPQVLNANSDAIVNIGTSSTSLSTLDKT